MTPDVVTPGAGRPIPGGPGVGAPVPGGQGVIAPAGAALVVALLAAAVPLVALASERFGGLAPCALCLWQRWPYWAAVALALAAAGLRSRALLGLAGVAVLVSAGLGALHLGVEQGWWPSPLPACAAPASMGSGSVDDMLRSLAARPAKPCDAPAYLVPGLPVSMAAMNVIYGLLVSALALRWARRTGGRRTAGPPPDGPAPA